MAKRKLTGQAAVYAKRSLDFLSEFGISSIQMGSKNISVDGNKVVEKTNKKLKRNNGSN